MAVYIDTRHQGRKVPRNFLGLSFEVSSLPQLVRYADTGNLVGLLRSLGHGVLRFGGVSADTRVGWSNGSTDPPWASSLITPADLRGLARLAASSDWRVLLTIGMAHFEPLAGAEEAVAAKAALGKMLLGIELGNEPDAYARHGFREEPWTFDQYALQAQSYMAAIAAAAPHIALAGPDVSGSAAFGSWGKGEAAQLRPLLLTGHHYPLGCNDDPPPSIERLLSVQTRRREDDSLERYMSVSRAARIPFRMDETNTVSCGGRAGISDTFASALWAVSYIARSMAAGVAGMNFHGEPRNCGGYAPLCAPTPERLAAGMLSVRPEWYALLLARQLLGDRAVRTRVVLGEAAAAARPNLSITGLRTPAGRLHLVVVDDDPPGSPRVLLHLHVGHRYASASELALTAPSPTAGGGVLLGGRSVAPDGSYSPPRQLPKAFRRGRLITVAVAPSSALLLTLA